MDATPPDRSEHPLRLALDRQLVRFLAVGLLNTGFSYSVYAFFVWLGLSYVVANLLSLLAGIVFSFRTQGKLVFGNADARLFGKYVLVWLVIFLVNIGCIRVALGFGANAYLAGALALVPTVALSYVLQKFVVFRR
jgi:putative flippase GtrA